MPHHCFSRVLAPILLLSLSAACISQPTPAPPSAVPTASAAAVTPTCQPLQATMSLPADLVVTPAAFNIILGRPTADAITVSLLAAVAQQVTLAYGTASGSYIQKTGPLALQANVPLNVTLSGLNPDTRYYYQVLGAGLSSGEHTFHTQRPPGSTFTFTIDADPHNRDPRFNGALYATTLTNALANAPDFHINLGDTFMTEKLKAQTYAAAESTFTDLRPYFGLLNADAPLFLVNGNHEGELGWLLTGKDRGLPIWSAQLRQSYYPGPTPDGFYTGSTVVDPALGCVRDGYYAWTWGDALFIVLDPFWYTTTKPQSGEPKSNWNWTLGREQYDWLKATLAASHAGFKFVFIHHLVGGAELDGAARGGIEVARYYEWGGDNADGTYGFDEHRSGWGLPIHQLLIQYQVSTVFHGHDHVFVKQELDGIVYQECPQPSMADYNNTRLAAAYGYVNGDVVSSSGHLRVTVSPDQVTFAYVRAYLPQDEKPAQQNGQVDYAYTLR